MYKYFIMVLWMLMMNFASVGQTILVNVNEKFSGIKNLEIKGGFCSVEVNGSDIATVDFNGQIKSSRQMEGFAIKHERKGDQLTIWVETPRMSWSNVNGYLKFIVPKEINLFVNNSSGSTQVSHLQYGGLVLENASGSINVTNIISNSRMSTASGSIRIEKHEGDVEAKSSSGSIRLSSITGNTTARSASGSIHINNVNGNVDAEAMSGSINLGNIQGALNLKTASGSIKGSEVLLVNHSTFRSSSGSISMDLFNETDKLGFDLSAASGSINVNGERRSKSYVKNNSGLMIKASTASGSQTYNFKRSGW